MTSQRGKVAVVTGGAMGIGRAIAARLAQDGADLVIADRENADEAVDQISSQGGRAMAFLCDVSSRDDVDRLGRDVEKAYGRCDILVNNAGVFSTRPFDEITFDDWKRTFAINLDAMFLTTKTFIGGMRGRGWGRIINLASNTLGSVVPHHVDYISSKGGVVGFTRALASEFGAEGITANAIAPGLMQTPGASNPRFRPRGGSIGQAIQMLAQAQAVKRPQTAMDVAGVASFLASDDAGFMSGQTFYVDGGLVRA